MTQHPADHAVRSSRSSAFRTRPAISGRLSGRLAYVVASRQAGGLVAPALTLRIIGLVVVLTVLLQLEAPFAVAACLPAVAICMLRARSAPVPVAPDRTRSKAQSASAAGRRRTRWIVITWVDLLRRIAASEQIVGINIRLERQNRHVGTSQHQDPCICLK